MVVVISPASTRSETMNDDNIHRTPALDKMGLARCRKDNKLFSWRKGGSCKVCGARVEAPEAPPVTAPKRARARKAPAAATGVKEAKRNRNGSAAVASKKKGNKS